MDQRLNYEASIKELEKIVKELEKGEMPLDRAIDLFATGINYVKVCKSHLDDAEGKIRMLVDEKEIDFNQWSKED